MNLALTKLLPSVPWTLGLYDFTLVTLRFSYTLVDPWKFELV